MRYPNSFASVALPTFALVAFALTGCMVDNSGGPPPAGDPIEFEVAIESPDLFCNSFADEATLLRSAADVDTFIEACGTELVGAESNIAEDLNAEIAELAEGQAVLIVSAQLGGCLGEWRIESIHLDGDVLRPWMLKADSSFGPQQVACDSDIGQDHQVLTVDDTAGVESVELAVGFFNPELPGAPTVDLALE
jgi:hypothetical protein